MGSVLRFKAVMLICALAPTTGQAGDDSDAKSKAKRWIEREHYVVLAAENTELQRHLEGGQAAKPYAAHLLIDGNALLADEQVRLERIDWKQLAQDLAGVIRFRKSSDAKAPAEPEYQSIRIHTYFHKVSNTNAAILRWTLEGFARERANFDYVSQTASYSGADDGLWQRLGHIDQAQQSSVGGSVREDAAGNEYVQVYPVRTRLSRLYTNNADCVVYVQPKFANEFGEGLPRSVRTSMTVFSRQLEFESKGKVLFIFRYSPPAGDKAKAWFLEEGAQEMTRLLGFENWAVTLRYESAKQ